MQRDGSNASLWSATTKEIYSDKDAGQNADIIIAGAGITGLTLGLLLQKSGKNVIILEAATPGFGTTGGTSAHINTFLDTSYDQISKRFSDEAALQVATLIRKSVAQIKENVIDLSIECDYHETAGYLFAVEEEQNKELESIVASAKKVHVAVELTNDTVFPIPYTRIALWESQAQFHPLKYINALAEAFRLEGGRLVSNCRVMHHEETNSRVTVQTNGNSYTADQLVYATHIPPGVNLIHLRCAPYRSYVIAVTLADDRYPDAMGYDMNDPYHYYRSHNIDGKRYLLIGGEDHKTGHEANTDACFLRLEAHARKFFNLASVDYKWSSQYFEPADGIPYIGNLPGSGEAIYVATGFGGNGITYGTAAAIVLRDVLTGVKSDYAKLFDPSRIKPIAGFSNFVKEGADVAALLIRSLLPKEKLTELADIAPGEARIIKWEGKSAAIYKQDNGNISAVNPACPHTKCTVAWNSTEKSWDCPCHGSRFSYDGSLLTGPASHDLAKIDIEHSVE